MLNEDIGHLESLRYGRHGHQYQATGGIVGIDITHATLQTHAKIYTKDASRCINAIQALKQTIAVIDELLTYGGAVHENGYIEPHLEPTLIKNLPAELIYNLTYNPKAELNSFRAGDVANSGLADMFKGRLLNKHPYAIITLVHRDTAPDLKIINGQPHFTHTDPVTTTYFISALAQSYKQEYKSIDPNNRSIISPNSAARIVLMEEALKFKYLTADHSSNR